VCHALGLGHCLTSSTMLRPQGAAVVRHGREGCQLPTSKTMRAARRWRGRVARQRVGLHLGAGRDGHTDRLPARGLNSPLGSLGARRAPLSYPGEPCWSAGSRCGHEGFGRAGPGSPHSAPGARTGSRFRPGRKIRLRVPPGEVVPIGTPLAAELGGGWVHGGPGPRRRS
jgi:hypothetical protein